MNADRPSRLSAQEGRQLLVHAATSLFRQRPPDQVSVREIASVAGVNHGLVHRYFGGKEGLVTEVLKEVFRETYEVIRARMADDMGAALDSGLGVLSRERWVVETLAWALLTRRSADGIPTASMMPSIRKRLGEPVSHEVAAVVAAAEAATLGWLLFEPLIARGTGLDHLEQSLRQEQFSQALVALLAPLRRALVDAELDTPDETT